MTEEKPLIDEWLERWGLDKTTSINEVVGRVIVDIQLLDKRIKEIEK